MALWLYLSMALLLVLAGLLLLFAANRSGAASPATQRRFNELLKVGVRTGSSEEGWIKGAAERMGGKTLGKIFAGSDQEEMTRLLKQAGWHAPRKRLTFWSATWLTPLAMVVFAVIVDAVDGDLEGKQKMALVFVAFVLGFLAPRYLLRYRAAARRNALAREMPTAIYLLRMLFDAGLSTEHTIRVMHEEGRILMPNLSEELTGVLQRFDAGHDRAEALSEMAEPLAVNELTDTVAIIKQVTRYGGNIRESLANFAQLIEERQQSAMREYVNRLSAKMSIVMMIFLFPALLIFLAGPGFLALARGLMNVAG